MTNTDDTAQPDQATDADSGTNSDVPHFDVVIIGAGVTGLYSLYRLRSLGFSVRVYEEADGVGGVWYWNRYPGARFDSQCPTYMYSFSDELLEKWEWKETYSPQPDNERYLNTVADMFDLRKDIQLNSRVASLVFDESTNRWNVTLTNGERSTAQFVITAVGKFSSGFVPEFPGAENFKGVCVHTGRWPHEGVDMKGKRVAIIGTGPTGVQIVPEVAEIASHLTVFQRTANYCAPLRNKKLTDEDMAEIRSQYRDIFAKCAEDASLFLQRNDPRPADSLTQEERFEAYEKVWEEQGRTGFRTLFKEIWEPGPINEEFSEWFKEKIRAQVEDPELADKVTPKDHMFGTKRIPGEIGYYDALNRENVDLVDIKDDPIETFTETGIKTESNHYEFDVIILATGWDVITGPLLAMDIRGEGGLTLRERWAEGLRTYIYLQSVGFPNLFLINATSAGNFVRAAEPLIDWLGGTLAYVRDHGFERIAPSPESEEEWTRYVMEKSAASLMTQSTSSYIGANVPEKPRVPLFPLFEGEKAMQERRAKIAENGYKEFELR